MYRELKLTIKSFTDGRPGRFTLSPQFFHFVSQKQQAPKHKGDTQMHQDLGDSKKNIELCTG
jgi:hypothetical protein